MGLWDDAVAGFQKSYRLSGDPALLFNVAQAQRQAGHRREALIAYKAYLRERPDSPHRELVEAKIHELESSVDAEAVPTPTGKAEAARQPMVWVDPFENRAKSPPSAPAESTVVPLPVVGQASNGATVSPAAARVPAMPVPAAQSQTPLPAPGSLTRPLDETPTTTTLVQPAGDQAAASQPGAAPTRWWLWTGIGAAVAAGIVTAVILSTRGSQRDGACPSSGFDGCLAVGK